MAESFINKMLFGNQEEQSTSGKSWPRKHIPISDQRLNEEHRKKFEARQRQLQEQQELAAKFKDFPALSQEKVPAVTFKKTRLTDLVNRSKPAYAEKMTDADLNEMLKEKQVFSLKQIENFFEGKLNQKVCFEGIPVAVTGVFPRSEGVAVQFSIRPSDIGALTLNRSINQINGSQPSSIVDIDGSGPVKLLGEIQGSICERFKVLFR